MLFERRIRLAVEGARDEGERVGDDIVVRAGGILGRHPFAAVRLVEVAAVGDELVVLNECAVVFFSWAVVAGWSRAGLQAVAWLQFLERGSGVAGLGVSELGVDGEAVGRVADSSIWSLPCCFCRSLMRPVGRPW